MTGRRVSAARLLPAGRMISSGGAAGIGGKGREPLCNAGDDRSGLFGESGRAWIREDFRNSLGMFRS